MNARYLVASFSTALLAACASTGGLQARLQPLDANQLSATQSLSNARLSAAAWPTAAWWQALGDAQLDALVDTALAGQPSLQLAEARVRQAEAAASGTNAALFPQINAAVRGTQQRFSEHSTVPKNIAGHWNSIDDGSLGLSYELDFWGKNRAAVNAALDRGHAVEVDLQAARLALTTAVVRSYLRLDAAFAQRDLAETTLHEREQTLALVQKRVAASLDSQLELTQAESALPAAREQIAVNDEAIALIRNQLAALEGQGPDAARSLNRPKLASATPVQIPAVLPVELLGRRPDVVAARWRVEAASEDITVATAQFYPNVTLNAFVGLQSLGLSDFLSPGSRVMGIGPAFSLPVFDGGRLRSNLRRNQADYDAAVATYNGTLIDALHDVVDQLVSLDALKQQQVEQNEALRLSQKAFDLATSRYRSGLASYLQVLAAEAQVLVQQRATIATDARQRELQLNLVRALGGGFQPASVS